MKQREKFISFDVISINEGGFHIILSRNHPHILFSFSRNFWSTPLTVKMFQELEIKTIEIIQQFGLFGVFLLAILESFIFPIPTALIVTTAIALKFNAFLVVVIATFGSVIGATIGYFLGKKGGRSLLLNLFDKEKVLVVDKMFEKYGVFAVGIAALTPIPFKLFTIAAGVANMRLHPFILVCIPTRFLQFLLFALFGEFLSRFFLF